MLRSTNTAVCPILKSIFTARILSTSEDYDVFNLFKTGVDVSSLITTVRNAIENRSNMCNIQDLSSVPSAHEGNRHAYLVKKVLDAYFEGNETVRTNYFQNGIEYRNRNTVSA